MGSRFLFALVLTGTFTSLGASYRTPNFVVEAPTDEAAERVAQSAERLRKAEAKKWLGKELADWSELCPVEVVLSKRVGGRADLKFVGGRVEQTLRVEGTLPLILNNVLPHEMTHIIIANHFHCQVPRWADEGMAILAEDRLIQGRHESRLRKEEAKADGEVSLRRLFTRHEYPAPETLDVFYAQSFGVTRFLVKASGRQEFLDFLSDGMNSGWDDAAQTHYGYRDLEAMEKAWRKDVRAKTAPPPKLAQGTP